jgi:restriction system protein
MAEITRKRTGELLRKLFEILLKYPEGLPAGAALKALSQSVTLTEYEAGFYEHGVQRFDKIVRFATIDLVKAGWLLKHKGTWTVTEAGVEAYKTHMDPETFYKTASQLYRQWKMNQPPDDLDKGGEPGHPVPDDDTATAAITYEQAEEQERHGLVKQFVYD